MCEPKLFQANINLPLRQAIYIILFDCICFKFIFEILKQEMGFIFYLLLGVAIMFGSRIWQQKYIAQLTDEHKAMLAQLFNKRSNINLYVGIAAIILFLIITFFDLLNFRLAILTLVLINVLATVIPMNINYNKMVKNNLPISFTNNYIFVSILRVLGTIVIFSYVLFENQNF